MKTNKRKLAVQWLAANEKEDTDRVAFGQREVDTVEFGSGQDLLEFMAKGDRFESAVIDLLNSQLHIRFGSQCAKEVMEGGLGEKASHANAKLAKADWDNPETCLKLDYISALTAYCESEGRSRKSDWEKFFDALPDGKKAIYNALSEAEQKAKREAFEAAMAAAKAF